MRLTGAVRSRGVRWGAAAAVLGGVLWVPYGIFEMLQPWGTDTVYSEDRGYELVTDTVLYELYSLPGGLALLFTSLGLLGLMTMLRLPAGRTGRIAVILAYAAEVLAVLSLAGAIVQFDPVFTASRIFGTLALGGATVLAGLDARKRGVAPGWMLALLALGLIGLFLLPLWPLVYAVQWLTEVAGAAIIALFGVGWLAAGYRLWAAAA